MDEKIQEAIRKYALENALRFKGKATAGAVIGKVLGEFPEQKKSTVELGKEIAQIVAQINAMSFEAQQAAGAVFETELAGKRAQKKAKSSLFNFLNIADGQKIVTVFPPEPSKYPHIGHAKAILLNYELAREYGGEFSIRFEDTNPVLAKEEFYKIHLDNYAWLGIPTDKVIYASDFLDTFYALAEKIIQGANGYICTCAQETIQENRFKGVGCQCRANDVSQNIELWKRMFTAPQGSMILRLKLDMESQNTTLRDPALIRIIDGAHPRTQKKYRLWPTYDFENAVLDGIQGTTHRLRSKEFELRSELQNRLQEMLGYSKTQLIHFARFNLEGVQSSGRIIRDMIAAGTLIGWDDPSLTTLVALRRRGFLPQAVLEFVLSTGISKAESTLTWDDLNMHNKRLLDSVCNRYFFIDEPIKIEIASAPTQQVALKIHPEKHDAPRLFTTNTNFYVARNDFDTFTDGKLYRMMDCLNFEKENRKFSYHSKDVGSFKSAGDKIIHWLPVQDDLVSVEVLMPDKTIKKGLGEPLLKNLTVGDEVQFVRCGFVRLDAKENGILKFWFTHA